MKINSETQFQCLTRNSWHFRRSTACNLLSQKSRTLVAQGKCLDPSTSLLCSEHGSQSSLSIKALVAPLCTAKNLILSALGVEEASNHHLEILSILG